MQEVISSFFYGPDPGEQVRKRIDPQDRMSDTILGCDQSCALYCQASWRVFAGFTVLDAVLNPGPLSGWQSLRLLFL